ncbi:MAG: phosphatase PAP2 family protein [Burkholderiaceae bacterium]|nr:phosphatase PAP2 family protein [Burkholderiaceae bacterium]
MSTPRLLSTLMLATLPALLPARAEDGFWDRMGRAAHAAATAPRTWAPLLGAVALQIGDADRKLQTRMAEHTPVFGSQQRADALSDDFRSLSQGVWVVTALLPWQDEPAESWFAAKGRVVLAQGGARLVTSKLTGDLKDGTSRMRPNGAGETSMPSDHATRVSLYNTMSVYNLQRMGWSAQNVERAQLGLDVLAGTTAWARVEANQHYPSDVLVGLGLGHFMGSFFTHAFLGPARAETLQVSLLPGRERFDVRVRLKF